MPFRTSYIFPLIFLILSKPPFIQSDKSLTGLPVAIRVFSVSGNCDPLTKVESDGFLAPHTAWCTGPEVQNPCPLA